MASLNAQLGKYSLCSAQLREFAIWSFYGYFTFLDLGVMVVPHFYLMVTLY